MPHLERVDADWASSDLDYQQPRCSRCHVVMRDIPGGWWCPSCQAGMILTTADSGRYAVAPVGPRQTQLRRGA